MWLIKKRIKVKLDPELLDSKGKPLYEERHSGEPCPEASGWPNPELWCIYVSDDGPEVKKAYQRYKQRTKHDFKDGYQENKEPEKTGPDRDQVIADLKAAIKNGADVDINEDYTTEKLLVTLSKAEAQVKAKKAADKIDPDKPPVTPTQKDDSGVDGFGFNE